MAPPFTITPKILTLVGGIMQLIGRFEGLQRPQPTMKLRKAARVKTVLGSLAIEGNTLTLEQATAVFEGKRVVGPAQEVQALQNALRAYEKSSLWSATNEAHFLKAHGAMMQGLVLDAGRYRTKGVGVFQGKEIAHVAPPAKRVPELVADLLLWLKNARSLDRLVASAVVHYELEFIHPFSDGNGRMGRLWQYVILMKRHPAFQWVPTELAVLSQQEEYYRVLAACDKAGNSTEFIEFSLSTVKASLEDFVADQRPPTLSGQQRLQLARSTLGGAWFSRKDYIAHWKTISSATASRDLRDGADSGRLRKEGDRAVARYRYT